MIPQHLDFRRLKNQLPIARVLAHRGLLANLTPRGPTLAGACPIHRGDNPNAFVVDTDKNLWYCFTRCQAGGDIVELVRRLDRASYAQAAQHLAELAATAPPAKVKPKASEPGRDAEPFRPFTRRLALDPDHPVLRRKGIWPETARAFEAGAYHGRGFLHRCLAVRLHDPRGQPLGYAGRHLDPDDARRYGKWKLPPRLPKHQLLYNLHRLQNPRELVIVEGPWSILRLHQIQIPAVALLGSHLSAAQARWLRPIPRLRILMDGDPAGRRAARRIAHQLDDHPDLSLVTLPEGLDPDDLDDARLVEKLRPSLF